MDSLRGVVVVACLALALVAVAEARLSPFDDTVQLHARRYGLDWRLVVAQIRAESAFKVLAESHVGARGLMQIMPSTARWLGVDPKLLWDAETNISLGCLYDAKLYAIFRRERGRERVAFMLAAYNAGPGRVIQAQKKAEVPDRWNDGLGIQRHLPGETQNYVPKILAWWDAYRQRME